MRRRHIGIAIAAVTAAIALPAILSAAVTAYTTPTLKVSVTGGTTVIAASGSVSDDPTARVAIYAPTGTTTTPGTPGATIGSIEAEASALALGGALLPLKGSVVLPPAGAAPPSSQGVCTQNQGPAAIWLLRFEPIVGQQIPDIPVYVVPTSGAETALGALKFIICLPPPDIPEANGGAPFGAKFIGLEATLRGALTPPAAGLWLAVWTPYQPGTGQLNIPGSVASPSATAPGTATITAKRTGARVTVSGTVTQGGQPVGRAAVKLVRGKTAGTLRTFRTVRTNARGGYSATALAATGTFFRATTVVAARANPAVCAQLRSSLPVPCINGTSSGFAATTRVVRAR